MADLEGKRAIVTGGSSGIGAATAQALADAGARVVTGSRSDGTLDVTDRASSEQFVARALAELGGLDILVNNAGLSRGRDPVWESHEEDEREVIETNVLGLMRMTRLCVPAPRRRRRSHREPRLGRRASGRIRTARRTSPRSSRCTATRARCATTCTASRCGSRTSLPGSSRRTSRTCGTRATRRRRRPSTRTSRSAGRCTRRTSPTASCSRSRGPPHVNIDEIVVLALAQVSGANVVRDQ